MELNVCWMVAFLYLIVAPFTKVEESFNIQAIHDILFHGTNVTQYDHLEYPGVVPRTFIGPIIIAIASTPAGAAARYVFPTANKMVYQVLSRATLGAFVLVSFGHFLTAVSDIFGKGVASKLILITATQFHFLFYATRTLPNTFALIPVMYALSFWLRNENTKFFFMAGVATLMFRCELALLFGPCALISLLNGKLSIRQAILTGVPIAASIIAVTFSVDSLFWRRWLWPEGEVFWYNIVRNKSHNWGTSPFLWYFYSVLPRSLLLSLCLFPIGIWFERRRALQLVAPAVTFIFLYSFLPHKELRFIIYTFPVINTVAAIAFDRIAKNWSKGVLYKLLWIACVIHLIVNSVCSGFMLYVSRYNYPGGVALQVLHRVVPPNETVHVHLSNLAAQTGVTRFGEEHSHWIYNKTEHLETKWQDVVTSFTHIIAEESSSLMNITKQTHSTIGVIKGLTRVDFKTLKVHIDPQLRLLSQRKLGAD